MTNRSHLTPVPTTDKRGRATTVYRNLGAPASSSLKVKAPVPAPSNPSAPSPLPTPAPLSPSALDELVKALLPSPFPALPDPNAVIASEPAGRTAAALAVEAIDAGVFTGPEACEVLGVAAARAANAYRFHGREKATWAAVLTRDAMQVAARLALRHTDRDGVWAEEVVDNMLGARYSPAKPLDDEASLSSLVAVVAFVIEDERERFLYTSTAHGGRRRSIANDALEDLVRERPQDLDRIIAHLKGDDYKADVDDDVARLREHLEATEDAPAFGSGWL